MAIYVAQEAFHYFGVSYAAGATVDTTGWTQHQVDQLVDHCPVSLQGTAGAAGPTGPAGPAGPAGAPGVVNERGEWASAAVYNVGDGVTRTGYAYVCTHAVQGLDPLTDPTDWALLGDAPGAPVKVVSTNYAMTATDEIINATGTITVTLPPVASANIGKRYTVKNTGTGTVTVAPASGTLDGAANTAMTVQYSSLDVVTDGTNWFTV